VGKHLKVKELELRKNVKIRLEEMEGRGAEVKE
jgi:hypothetical protein